MRIKAFLLAAVTAVLFCGCAESVADQAEQQAKDFTRKMCPTPYINDERTDSVVFVKDGNIYTYYKKLRGKADNEKLINKLRPQLRSRLLEDLRNDIQSKRMKEEGFVFKYVYRSDSTGKTLLVETFTKKDYAQ